MSRKRAQHTDTYTRTSTHTPRVQASLLMPVALPVVMVCHRYVSLVQAYGNDLKTVQEVFLEKRDSPPIASNLPLIAGTTTPRSVTCTHADTDA